MSETPSEKTLKHSNGVASCAANCEDKQTPSNKNKPSHSTTTDPFQLLGDDVHAHILGFRMCLREGRAKPASTARNLYEEANRERVTRENPRSNFWEVGTILDRDYTTLDPLEKKQWFEKARLDQERHDKEESVFTRPNDLFGITNGLALVSKQWFSVAGQVMNAKATSSVEILSSRQLFELKCRALSLDLSSICRLFLQEMHREWGQEYILQGNDNEDGTNNTISHNVVELILASYGGEVPFANLVATEYVKFLVVKCVETLARHHHHNGSHNNSNDSSSGSKSLEAGPSSVYIWKEPCEVTNLLELFWRAHAQADKDKYAADCQLLIGQLMSNQNDNPLIKYGAISVDPQGGCDYISKRNILFQFEKQLPPRNFFFGRFGDILSRKRAILSQEFDIHAVARNVLEAKNQFVIYG